MDIILIIQAVTGILGDGTLGTGILGIMTHGTIHGIHPTIILGMATTMAGTVRIIMETTIIITGMITIEKTVTKT